MSAQGNAAMLVQILTSGPEVTHAFIRTPIAWVYEVFPNPGPFLGDWDSPTLRVYSSSCLIASHRTLISLATSP